jgi:hypothetical protein
VCAIFFLFVCFLSGSFHSSTSMSSSPSALDRDQNQTAWRDNDEQAIGPSSLAPINGNDDHHNIPAQDPEHPVDYPRGSSVGDTSIPPKPDLEPPVFREKQVKVLRFSLFCILCPFFVFR